MKKDKDKALLWRRYIDNLYTMEDVRNLGETDGNASREGLPDDLIKEVWEETALMQPAAGEEYEEYKEEARRLLKRMDTGRRVRLRRAVLMWAGIAAMLCVVWGGFRYWQSTHPRDVTWLTASTSYGEQKELRLPDGTLLMLNACSQVRYPEQFTEDSRRIELEGEGYFRVTHDEEQPFIVTTSVFDVQVLGTSFNVRAYAADETAAVNVESGKVQVDLPEAMMRLKANEQVLIDKVADSYSKQHDERQVAIWRSGGLRFDSTPIHDVAKVLERRYNCRITFAEGEEFNNLISGEHDNRSLENVLRSIEYTSGIHYRISGNRVFLYK